MKSYVVIGLGRFGASLARQLCKLGAEVLALDVKGDLVQQVASEVTHAVVGDAQDKEVLRALGVRNMDCAIIAIGDNLAASVLITMNLKELGIPFIVCKAHDETHRKVLEKLGVDRVVIPEIQMTVADYMRQVHTWCKEYVENFEKKGGNLIFTGSTGVGKTFLTNCIAKALIDQYQSVIYLSSNDLFDVFSKNKFHYDTEEEMKDMYQYILDCDLLIIDDLGTELNNTFVSSQLFYCINERLLRKKSTIISTNLSMTMLRDTYSDRISSRIISQYSIIPLYGDDIRTKIV